MIYKLKSHFCYEASWLKQNFWNITLLWKRSSAQTDRAGRFCQKMVIKTVLLHILNTPCINKREIKAVKLQAAQN